MGMIEAFQDRVPSAALAINGNNHPLVKERGEDAAIGQFRRRIDVRGLLKRAVADRAMVGRFIDFAPLACGRLVKAMIGGPPVPENFSIPIKFEQEIQSGTRNKIATARS